VAATGLGIVRILTGATLGACLGPTLTLLPIAVSSAIFEE